MADWTREYMALAQAEGWDVFHTGNPGCEWELQRIDDPQVDEVGYDEPKFATDADAWEFVVRGAREGLAHCVAALAFLEEKAPAEHLDILKFCGEAEEPAAFIISWDAPGGTMYRTGRNPGAQGWWTFNRESAHRYPADWSGVLFSGERKEAA